MNLPHRTHQPPFEQRPAGETEAWLWEERRRLIAEVDRLRLQAVDDEKRNDRLKADNNRLRRHLADQGRRRPWRIRPE